MDHLNAHPYHLIGRRLGGHNAVVSTISRRGLLLGAGAVGLVAGCGGAAAPAIAVVDPHGPRQAGIARPPVPQRHCAVSVWDIPADTTTDAVLTRLSASITALATGVDPALTGLPAMDLTVTVGVGPRVAPGIGELPVFPGDQVPAGLSGGDLLLQVCGNDPLVVSLAVAELARIAACTPKWCESAFRGPATTDGTARNILGFVDGIVVPHGDSELDREVWLDGDPATRGGSVAVIRRMRLDIAGFLAQPIADQERIFGRRKDTSEPLSGGGARADVDLGAKSPDGEYVIPADAHVRRAHPLAAGTGVMLRRSYNYDNGMADRGLLFISFQRELRTFVNTAYRMADGDALLRFATTTASAAFLILPGFTPGRPLTAS